MINLNKNIIDIKNIKLSCILASNVLDYITPFVILNINTNQLDKLCFFYIKNYLKAFPCTLNYFLPNYKKYPKSICTSLNNILCHGIPNYEKIKNSNIINLDICLIKNGYFSDNNKMFSILIISKKIKNLLRVSFFSLWKSIKKIKLKFLIKNIGKIIYNYIYINNYNVIKEYCGHGVGFFLHEPPEIINYFFNKNNIFFKNKMIFTIEPIVNIKKNYIIKYDNWSSKIINGDYCSQWEHTVLFLNKKYEILT